MSVIARPRRGLRLMTVAVGLMMLLYVLELLLALWTFSISSMDDAVKMVTWMARLRVLNLAVDALLIVGVIDNLGELRRRRASQAIGIVGLAALAIAFAIHGWSYQLLADVATSLRTGHVVDRAAEIDKVPTRMFLATVAYVIGLGSTVLMVRMYALTEDNLGLREQARNIGGMLVLLLGCDTFYRFTYGLGSGTGVAMVSYGMIAAIGVAVFWFWCHRQLGHLYDTTRYLLAMSSHMPAADVVRSAPAPRPAPVTPAPIAPVTTDASTATTAAAPSVATPRASGAPLVPLAGIAPPRADTDAPPPTDGGPRLLR